MKGFFASSSMELNQILGNTFLAPRKIQELRTKGIVSVGSPYGKSQVLILAASGTVRQAATIPDKGA